MAFNVLQALLEVLGLCTFVFGVAGHIEQVLHGHRQAGQGGQRGACGLQGVASPGRGHGLGVEAPKERVLGLWRVCTSQAVLQVFLRTACALQALLAGSEEVAVAAAC